LLAIIASQADKAALSIDHSGRRFEECLMLTELQRSLMAPLLLWRTMLLVFVVGSLVARLSGDATAVLLIAMACAFLLRNFERRRWIEMTVETHAGDIVARIFIALFMTFTVCYTEGHSLLQLARMI
jgi:hypothetical protein